MLTQERVRELFDYDVDSGNLIRRTLANNFRAKIGGKVGWKSGNGYLKVSIDNKKYYVHRVIWLWSFGYFPEFSMDHKNRNRSDNRLSNLREASQSCNLRNIDTRQDSVSGVTGVCIDNRSGRWAVSICINKSSKYLGLHSCLTEAVAHRFAAEQCVDWRKCNSRTPAQRYMEENIL